MIKNITITGVKYELNDTTKKYVERKIGGLGKYLPRHARKSVTADVKIKQIDNPGGNKYEVEVIINVPDKKITAKFTKLIPTDFKFRIKPVETLVKKLSSFEVV